MSDNLRTVVQENSRNLLSIPSWVLQIPTITRLSLRKNNISLVPTDIAQLSQLKRLDLSENQLYSIPAEVGVLTGLEILQLAANHISALPRTLGKCINLQILDVKANKLIALPHFFTRLVALRQLDASHNVISSKKSGLLPAEADGPLDSLWQLTSLVSLSLDGNNLQRLPANIAQLTNIERLSLANCGLPALPSHLCALVKMKQLFLSDNSFDRLPKLIGNMLFLQELDCDDTLLWDLPATMGRCSNLTRLRLSNCPLNWPLLELVMQEPKKVIQFLMEREVAEFHAEPLGDVPTLRAQSPPVAEIYKVHTATQGLMRFYAHVQMKTQAEFQEQFDLCNQSHNFQTLEQQTRNLRAVQKDLASRAARELADEVRGYTLKQMHAGFKLK